jgi:tetratricopeptide (TPR) repeat protein
VAVDRPARAPAALLILALAGAAAAYGAGLDAEFHLDDGTSIRTSWRLRSLERALDVRPLDLLGPARPVADLTYALDYARAGLRPSAYHLTSLLLHLAAALLVLLLAGDALRRVDHPRAAWLAALVAAAFALHPIQVESVAYAAQRSEVLSALLGLGALLVLLRAEVAATRPRAAALSLAAAALTLLALGSKAVAVALPPAYLLHRLLLPGAPAGAPPRAGWRRALAVAAPSLALAAAAVARNLVALDRPGASAGPRAGALGPWRYLLTQLEVQWTYLRLLAWPSGLSVDHGGYPASDAVPGAGPVAAILGLAALVAAAAWGWREAGRRAGLGWARLPAFGLGWWLLLLAPTSSVVPIADLVAEHRTYLASAGVLLAAAALGDAALRRLLGPRAAAAGLAVALAGLVALGASLAARVQVWRTERALWADAAAKSPRSCRAALNLAYADHEAGDAAAALAGYLRAEALARTPDERAEVARNRSALHLDLGEPALALAVADRGLAARPQDADLRNNRSIALSSLGRLEEAIAEARRAIAIAPGEPDPRSTLGLHLLAAGRPGEAADAFRSAFDIDPGDQRFAEQALVTLARAGRREEACEVARAARARHGAALAPSLRVELRRISCP